MRRIYIYICNALRRTQYTTCTALHDTFIRASRTIFQSFFFEREEVGGRGLGSALGRGR